MPNKSHTNLLSDLTKSPGFEKVTKIKKADMLYITFSTDEHRQQAIEYLKQNTSFKDYDLSKKPGKIKLNGILWLQAYQEFSSQHINNNINDPYGLKHFGQEYDPQSKPMYVLYNIEQTHNQKPKANANNPYGLNFEK